VRALPVRLRQPDPSLRRLDRAIVLVVLVLGAVTAAIWFDPRIPTRVVNLPMDIAINVAATLVGGTVALLGWVRWRATGRSTSLYQASAFTALSVTNALMTGLVIAGHGDAFGLDQASPGAAPAYLWSATRLVAAVLLLLAAIQGIRGARVRIAPSLVAIGPTVALMLGTVALVLAGGLRVDPVSRAVDLMQLAAFAAFLGAAICFRRLFARDRHASDAVLLAGSIVAAFSQLHFVFDPAIATGVVTTGDLLRVGFTAILLFGIQVEIQDELVAVQSANLELARLSDVDAANATMAERARLAREIHDGLAQDLWYAKLKQGRVAGALELSEETRLAAREVLTALDAALAEARQSVMAMRADPTSGSTLEEVLRAYVDDFGDRFGLRAEFQSVSTLPRLSPRTEAEVLRIIQEALNNVRKHADATVVRVGSEVSERVLRLTVSDNGRGFEVAAVPRDRFGLASMQERAEGVGAELTIHSRPSDGTQVVLDLPIHTNRKNGVA